MNKCVLHGRLARDPELRSTPNGTSVATFSLAVDRPRTRDGKKEADFIPCVAWSGLADVINKHFVKGKEILVEGRIQVRSYDAKDGSKRYVTEVIVGDIDFCGSKNDNSGPIAGTQVNSDDIPY